jgi:hypothetical protein
MTIVRALADVAFLERDREVLLCAARGVLAHWPRRPLLALNHDPPRLAVASDGAIEIVDVATGDVERRIDGVVAPLAFAKQGAPLVAMARGQRVVVIEDDGRAEPIDGVPDEVSRAHVVAAGTRAIAFIRRGFPQASVVWGIDLVERRTTWRREIESAMMHDVCIDDAGARVALAVGDRVLLIETSDGDIAATVSVHSDEPVRPQRLFANRELTMLAAVCSDGSADIYDVADFARPSFVAKSPAHGNGDQFDLERALSISVGATDVRLYTLDGALVCKAEHAKRPCFAGATAAAIVEGCVVALTRHGVVPIEGPTNIVALATHPRGVLAVDSDDRAHVIAIDDTVSS